MIGLFVTLGLAGCTTPSPEPTPTPTGFATEAEAFAAAEATYRAYVDALNQVDLSDPATFEPFYGLTNGDLNASDRETFSGYHAEGITKTGEVEVTQVSGAEWSEPIATLRVCYDVSNVEIVDAKGTSLVTDRRPDVQSLDVVVDVERHKVTKIGASTEPLAC